MGTISRFVYWDACVFIKHFAPKAKPDEKYILEGIDEVIDEAEQGKTLIITSSITRVEVLACDIPADGVTTYRKFLRREIVQEYDVDPRIGDAAHDIRAFYAKKGKMPSLPDSIHLATACLRGAAEFFTLEGTGKKPKLTALSGRIADRWDLVISTPRATMGRLFTLQTAKLLETSEASADVPGSVKQIAAPASEQQQDAGEKPPQPKGRTDDKEA